MANVIKIKRGLLENLSAATMQIGEPAFTTDEKALYIFDGTNKIKVGRENVLAAGDNISSLNNDSNYITNTALSGYVPTTRTVNTKPLSSNIVLTAADVSAVPTTRKINTKPLSADVTLTAADVSAVPTTRTVNTKPLSSNIVLTAADVSAIGTSDIIDGGTF